MITRRKYLPSQYVVPQSDVSIMLWQIRCATDLVENGKKPFSYLHNLIDEYVKAIDINNREQRVAAYTITECVQMREDAIEQMVDEENRRSLEELKESMSKRQK